MGTASSNPWQVAWRTGVQAVRKNRLPAIFLWAFGLALIISYYFVPVVGDALNWIGLQKQHWGFLFSMVSTALFGGLLPALIPRLLRIESSLSVGYILSNTMFWALKGIEIDLFYRGQAAVFGDQADVLTISAKTLVDQLVYVPTIGLVNCKKNNAK